MTGPKAPGAQGWGPALLALIVAVGGVFRLGELDGLPPFIDESANLALSVDYQSWDVWSRLLHGKLLGYLWFKPIYLVAWDPLYAARLLSAVTGMLVVLAGYRLFRTQVSQRAALAGTALLAFIPMAVFHDRLALFEGFVTLAVTVAVLLYLRAGRNGRLTLLAAGSLFGLALLTKGYALLAVPLWLPVLRRLAFAETGGWSGLVRVGLGAVASFMVVSVFLAVQLKEGLQNLQGALEAPGRFLAADLSLGERAVLGLQQLGQIFEYLRDYNGWAFIGVMLLAAVLPGGRWRYRLALVSTWLLYCAVLCIALRFLFSRYLLLTLPAVALLAALTFEDCLDRMSGRMTPLRRTWPLFVFLLLLTGCLADFLYRDTRIAAQSLQGILPARDAYQYVWGAPSGFGLRDVADELIKLEQRDSRKLICVTRGMGTGTHGAATLPLILRHRPIRFVHLWMRSDDDIRLVKDLSRQARVVLLEDEPEFVNAPLGSELDADLELLFEVKGRIGRPDYRLYEIVSRNR